MTRSGVRSPSAPPADQPNNLMIPHKASRTFVDRVDPVDFLRFFHRLHITDVDDDGLIVRADEDALQHIVWIGVDLLVRDIGRYENEIPRPCLGYVFEFVAPTHAGLPAHDVD